MVHYGFIETFIEQLGKEYNIREIAFDRWVRFRWYKTSKVWDSRSFRLGRGSRTCPRRRRNS